MPKNSKHDRDYDIVVFGATGYTGKHCAEHIATHLPSDLRWALAGRSEAKLRDLVEECRRLNPDRAQPAVEICNLDAEQLDALAKKTFILITTVGPYGRYGNLSFKACAENGTHYLDVTGELPWVYKMLKNSESTAKATGAMMFPQFGIESAPADLVTWTLAKALRTESHAQTRDVTLSIHNLSSAPSGGTLQSVLSYFDNFTIKEVQEAMAPYALSPISNPVPIPKKSLLTRLTGLVTVPRLGLLTTALTARTDGAIVERTWGLLSTTPSRKNEAYGPAFSFTEHLRAKSWFRGIAMHYSTVVIGALLALCPPFRGLLRKFMYQPGQGPERDASKKDYVEYRGVANSDPPSAKQAFARAWFSGSMYLLTAVLVSQAAATILEDDVELEGGVYTPACLGQKLIDRVDAAGFHFETELLDK